MIDPAIEKLLRSPCCKSPLSATQRNELAVLTCEACDNAYPFEDGIPILIPDEALPPEPEPEG